jgi:hypothetical protein
MASAEATAGALANAVASARTAAEAYAEAYASAYARANAIAEAEANAAAHASALATALAQANAYATACADALTRASAAAEAAAEAKSTALVSTSAIASAVTTANASVDTIARIETSTQEFIDPDCLENLCPQQEVYPRALCSVSPQELELETTYVGGSTSRSFTVTNSGSSSISGSITESSPHFVVYPTYYSLSPGDSESITVLFTPTSTGYKQTTINLEEPCHDVVVGGQATRRETTQEMSVSTDVRVNQTCEKGTSHQLVISWETYGGQPPRTVNLTLRGPGGFYRLFQSLPSSGSRSINLDIPEGGEITLTAEVRDYQGSSSRSSSGVQLSPCHQTESYCPAYPSVLRWGIEGIRGGTSLFKVMSIPSKLRTELSSKGADEAELVSSNLPYGVDFSLDLAKRSATLIGRFPTTTKTYQLKYNLSNEDDCVVAVLYVNIGVQGSKITIKFGTPQTHEH